MRSLVNTSHQSTRARAHPNHRQSPPLHIKAATNSMDTALHVTLYVVNAIGGGALPLVLELLDSMLIGIDKLGGTRLRSIAIGAAWMRLVGLCAMLLQQSGKVEERL